jgi:NAD-dependent SIR2 family protein deacetylase
VPREPKDRNVYILGAGFSAPAGAPLLRTFLDVSRQINDDPAYGLDDQEQIQFHRVFQFKHAMAAAREKFVVDLDNIEDLFGLIEISNRLGEEDGQLRRDVIYLIAKTLQVSIMPPGSSRPQIAFHTGAIPGDVESLTAPSGRPFRDEGGNNFTVDLYTYFAALVAGLLDAPQKRSNRKDTIITFNYDLICDDAIRRVQCAPNYGLPGHADLPGATKSLDILKLHGSANWAYCPNCRGVRVLEEKVTEAPQAFRDYRCCGGDPCELLLVPPSWDKAEYRAVIKSVWSRAVEELRLATRICVIGYSMPQVDAFFKYLLTLALSRNDHLLKLIVVDPEPAMEQRYRDVFDQTFQHRRFNFVGYGVTEFLGNRMSIESLGRAEGITGYVNFLPVH